MISKIRDILSHRNIRYILETDRTRAAVLIPLYINNGEYFIIFTRRTQTVGTHKGQISFPGGVRDQADASLLETALRESMEEVGISPDSVDVIGRLDDFATHVSYFVISPFIGLIPWPYKFTINESETAEIIHVPVSALLQKTCMSEGNEIVDDELVPACFYTHHANIIWGATARILQQFLEIWKSAGSDAASRNGNQAC